MSGNTPVRTFRLDGDRWERLGQWADRRNLTASEAIRDLIDWIDTWALSNIALHAEWREQTMTVARIATMHLADEQETPMCEECGHAWPCRTYRVTEGTLGVDE